MIWSEEFGKETKPGIEMVDGYINCPYWHELQQFLNQAYGAEPSIEYSCCSGAKGWNVKYKRGSRALCTVYPKEGFFTCLISVGRKELHEVELLMDIFTPYLQNLYEKSLGINGSKWLMIDVTSEEILGDVKELIGIRVKPLKK